MTIVNNTRLLTDTSLTKRVRNCLGYINVFTIEELGLVPVGHLICMPNLGAGSIREILKLLSSQHQQFEWHKDDTYGPMVWGDKT